MPGTVIQVANGGRGFVIQAGNDCYVVTAAHCLVELPAAFGAAGGVSGERTYDNFLGPLGALPKISAECVFVDPVADLAVFGEPNSQEFFDQSCAYEELTGSAVAFALGNLPCSQSRDGSPTATSEAMMQSLDGEWFACRVNNRGRSLWIEEADRPIRGGMSGSPIITPDGCAIGVVCVAEFGRGTHTSGPNPLLSASLPAWIIRGD